MGTTSQAAGRARLRKYVTTENETVTVPVKKEKAVLETEPVTAANIDNATEGPGISEEEHEVVLNEERVVVDKTVDPVERVRLDTETVTEEQTFNEKVRKEHIEVEGDVDQRRGQEPAGVSRFHPVPPRDTQPSHGSQYQSIGSHLDERGVGATNDLFVAFGGGGRSARRRRVQRRAHTDATQARAPRTTRPSSPGCAKLAHSAPYEKPGGPAVSPRRLRGG